jgi:O-antigen ligase
MSLSLAGDRRPAIGNVAILVLAAAGAWLFVGAAGTPRIRTYVDTLERSGALYVLAGLAPIGLLVVLRYPRLWVGIMWFLVPFNTVGGTWGEGLLLTLVKVLITVALAASLIGVPLAPASDRRWILGTALGQSLIAWLFVILVGVAIGFLSTPTQADWIRESYWMLFFAGALATGTLIRDRVDLRRLLWTGAAGVGLMQVTAFYQLSTGRRYQRLDVDISEAFFRAPFSAVSVFYLYLCLSLFLTASAQGWLGRRQRILLLAAIAILGAGLLGTLGRGLWIATALGLLPLAAMMRWNRRTLRAAALVAVIAAASVGLVVILDGLSTESHDNWVRLAWDFLLTLNQESVTVLGREREWLNAYNLWLRSPLLGFGWGYPYPDNPYNIEPADLFYMHNSYLNVLAKCGLVGLIALLAMIARAGDRLRRNWVHGRGDVFDRALTAALTASITQMVVLGLFVPQLTTSDSVLGFAMFVGLTAAQARILAHPG